MRLVSFSTSANGQTRLGLLHHEEVIDVDVAARALKIRPCGSIQDVLDQQAESMPTLHAILAELNGGQAFSAVRTSGAVHALHSIQLDAPIPLPRKNILCIGRNYHDHALESYQMRGQERPTDDAPVFFTKATTSINTPNGKIVVDPNVSTDIDWEVELAVIIGKTGKNISEADALTHVFGYTVLNDVTARDLQEKYKQFFKGKSLDGYCPIGPCIVTADEIPDPQQLTVRLRVNGVSKQEAHTSNMIYSVRTMIAHLSLGMTLEPGDIIATGTPSGIGKARKPPEYLKPGDVMETEVNGIGVLRNEIVSA